MVLNCQSGCAMLLQLEFTAWPGHPRSRLTPQNANLARWFCDAKLRIEVHASAEVNSDWSLRPFMPEIPRWLNAAESLKPNALFNAFFVALAALMVADSMLFPAPKSNGMIVKMSMLAWTAAARWISWVPAKFGPLCRIGMVTMTVRFGRCCFT